MGTSPGSRRDWGFRLLGPVQATANGRVVDLGGRKPRAVLAMLLLTPNHVVSFDRLKDGIWGDFAPPGATNALQVFVSRIRAALGERANAPGDVQTLVTAAGGYMIRVDPDQVDLWRFERLFEQARAALTVGNAEAASQMLEDALGLWRGEALGDVAAEPFGFAERARLEEHRLAAHEVLVCAQLELGRHCEVAADLEASVEMHPLRERLTELLMITLYRCGRQSDALAVYETHRDLLLEQAGLNPSQSLRARQREILMQAATLDLPAGDALRHPATPHGSESPGPGARRRNVVVVAAAAVCLVLLALALSLRHHPARSAPPAAAGGAAGVAGVSDQLREDRDALESARHQLVATRQELHWLTRHYPVQFRLAVRAIGWIQRDQAIHRSDRGRRVNDGAAAAAVALVGTPYRWGGASPTAGFDSSGLVRWVWRRFGVTLPHNAAADYDTAGQVVDHGPQIHYAQLAIGDLLFFDTLGHVSIYIGHGYIVDAPYTGAFVQIVRLTRGSPVASPTTYIAAVRVRAHNA